MAYRDDQDALIERAEALERETQRLKNQLKQANDARTSDAKERERLHQQLQELKRKHGDPAKRASEDPRARTRRKRFIVLAIISTLILGGIAGTGLFREYTDRKARTPATTSSRPRLIPRGNFTESATLQEEYARYLNRSLRAKGRSCIVRAAGRTLEIGWAGDQVDNQHMSQLKTANGFVDILRERGFDTLVLKVDQEVVWRRAF